MRILVEDRGTLSGRLRGWAGEHPIATVSLAVVVILSLIAGIGYHRFSNMQRPDPDFDARVSRPGYGDTHPWVLFDAAHFNFHTATANYRPFADLIRNDGYHVGESRKKFAAETLRGVQVLVIANALGGKGMFAMLANLIGVHSALQWNTNAFTPTECDAVRDWVGGGGGLLLISDHAPTGKAAQALAMRFGVDMSNWWVEDDKNSDPEAYAFITFTRANGLLLSHPVTDGRGPDERVDKVITFTGQSLSWPAGSTPFLRLASTAREYPARTGPFQDGRSAAGRAQGVALVFGRGRVVVLGEAAMLSAQVFHAAGREIRLGMEYPGFDNRRLALNIMHWLSGLIG